MRKLAFAIAAALLGGLGLFGPVAPTAAAANPKVAIIVGATHGVTPSYRDDANQIYAEAIKYTTNVVKVYSPNATWSKVKAAVNGASIVVYLGHGNGWPSPYTYDPEFTTKDGFGLNADVNKDGKLSDYELKYFGEPKIATLEPAPNAVVLLFHLCYASGNSESGKADPSLSTAKQRVDNYASAFLRAGARAVIANGHSHDPYYIRALFTTRESIDDYWRGAPDFNDNVSSHASSRTPGMTFLMDPEGAGKYYRSITGKMSLNTADVTGAAYASTAGDPATMVVPGNASPIADGTPVFGSVAAAAAGTTPATTVPASDKVRVESRETTLAADGSPIYKVHTDSGASGWMIGSGLHPRDSAAPRVWEVDDGAGTFSPNGDGAQDALPLSVRMSEAASWTLRFVNGDGDTLASKSGSGDTASMTWSPAAHALADGSYRWEIEATDGWGNGPLEAHGSVAIDTHAPDVTVSGADAPSVTTFTPNGDGSRDTVSFSVGSSEPGSVVATVTNGDGNKVDGVSVRVGGSSTTLTWDGRTGGAYVPDGRYNIAIAATDRAGNTGDPQLRTIDVYGALSDVATAKAAFFPQDGDALGRTVTLSFELHHAATTTWAIEDAAGHVVRALKSDEALSSGAYSAAWDGRNDDGDLVARGTYRSVVRATNGTQGATQSVSVVADAFRIVSSDTSPARRQKITVTATSAEGLEGAPRLAVYQPGIGVWKVTMGKVGGGVFKATITLKSSSPGTLRLRVYGIDDGGESQGSNLYLPLH